jgi:hypothetical protein
MSIAPFGVVAQSRAGLRMQGYEARLADLGVSNRQNAFVQVDIVSLKTDRLGEPHPRDGDQLKQIMVRSNDAVRQADGRASAAANNALTSTSL